MAVLVGPHPEFTADLLDRQWGLSSAGEVSGGGGGDGGSCGCGGCRDGCAEAAAAERARQGKIAADLRAAEAGRRRFWCGPCV